MQRVLASYFVKRIFSSHLRSLIQFFPPLATDFISLSLNDSHLLPRTYLERVTRCSMFYYPLTGSSIYHDIKDTRDNKLVISGQCWTEWSTVLSNVVPLPQFRLCALLISWDFLFWHVSSNWINGHAEHCPEIVCPGANQINNKGQITCH